MCSTIEPLSLLSALLYSLLPKEGEEGEGKSMCTDRNTTITLCPALW
jgi:hypothetical protein